MSNGVIQIRTSERLLFRKCRRLWGWMSPYKMNLEVKHRPDYFWFGTGMHWALEDYHGYNLYGSPAKAFWAYHLACKEARTLPPTADELIISGLGMMEYYSDIWLGMGNRDPLQTFWHEGRPMCELRFEIPLPIEDPQGRQVVYRGTLDGVAIDEHGRLWVKEYKSAKAFRLYHYDTDDQITAYCWALQSIFPEYEVAGVCYQQHKKTFPKPPKILKSSGKVSTAANQGTTYALYQKVLKDVYGSWDMFPAENKAYLNKLATEETEDYDNYIRRDWIYRNPHQLAAQGEKILLEAEDILNPNLALYPNPGKDCAFMCPLEAACVAMDDGSDWESLLTSLATERQPDSQEEQDKWRNHLPQPSDLPPMPLELVQLDLQDPSLLEEDSKVMLLELLDLQ